MKKYTVLLLRPDYIAGTFGHDTLMLHVKARNATEALSDARKEAVDIDELTALAADYYPLLIASGHIRDLTGLVRED